MLVQGTWKLVTWPGRLGLRFGKPSCVCAQKTTSMHMAPTFHSSLRDLAWSWIPVGGHES